MVKDGRGGSCRVVWALAEPTATPSTSTTARTTSSRNTVPVHISIAMSVAVVAVGRHAASRRTKGAATETICTDRAGRETIRTISLHSVGLLYSIDLLAYSLLLRWARRVKTKSVIQWALRDAANAAKMLMARHDGSIHGIFQSEPTKQHSTLAVNRVAANILVSTANRRSSGERRMMVRTGRLLLLSLLRLWHLRLWLLHGKSGKGISGGGLGVLGWLGAMPGRRQTATPRRRAN